MNDGLDVLTDLVWLQGAFDNLVRLLHSVIFWRNDRKTFGMICRPCRTAGTQSKAVYERRMMGERIIYQARQRVRVH